MIQQGCSAFPIAVAAELVVVYAGRVVSNGVFRTLTDKRSAALHEEVARRLKAQPELLRGAQRRVSKWLTQPQRHPYAQAWSELLRGDADELYRTLTSPDPGACTLRQASPFAGTIDSRTRWRILKAPTLREL